MSDLPNVVAAALGRMIYSLHALINGWSAVNEDPNLQARVLFVETASMSIQLHSGSVPDARAWFDKHAEDAWEDLLRRNPHLAASVGEFPPGGGN